MTITYLLRQDRHVEHVASCDLHRWALDHPDAVVLRATPDPAPTPDSPPLRADGRAVA